MASTHSALNLTNQAAGSAATNDLRDLKAPVAIPPDYSWLWWVIGALLVALLAWWLFRKYRRQPQPLQVPREIIPAHVRARQKLQEALAHLDDPRQFCIAASDALRTYLEERFELPAPERTTDEFLEVLEASPSLSYDQKQRVGGFLMRCDLAKFARYRLAREDLQAIYESALQLVVETEPAPVDATAPAAAAAQPPSSQAPA